MASSNYLPSNQIDLSAWSANFADEIATRGAALGFSPTEITDITAAITAFRSALDSQQTSRENAAAAGQTKDLNRTSMVEIVRATVKRLQANPDMTDPVRAAFRITIPTNSRTPAPPPTTRPLPTVNSGQRLQHTLKIADETDPTRRARRPDGVAECEIRLVVQEHDTAAPMDPMQMPILTQSTKTTVVANFTGDQGCKSAWYCARWRNSRGESGPWSQMVMATIAA